MGVTGDRLDPAMTEQAVDDRQAFAEGERPRREVLAEILLVH